MTLIKSVSAKGFKSFAKPTEIKFIEGFNLVIGPNGSGKSTDYNTIVTLATGEEIKIGDLVESKLKESREIKTLNDGVYCETDGTSILSINPITMKLEEKNISKFIKRSGEELYHLKTRSGRKVKATGCHPVMVLKNGRLKSVLLRDLKEKDLIATPREIKTKPNLNFDKDKSRLLGYLIGDGYLGINHLNFVNSNTEIINDFRCLVKKCFPKIKLNAYSKGKNVVSFFLYRKDHFKEMRNLFIKDCKKSITSNIKKIPDVLFCTDNDCIRHLLAGLFDTDGSVRRDISVIEYCSKNKELVSQVQRLLLRFGILSVIKRKIKWATNTKLKIKRDYYSLYIYGHDNLNKFYVNIPLRCKHKKEILELHVSKEIKTNANIDLLPRETNYYIKRLVSLLGIKVKPLKKEFPILAAYCENVCLPTREGLAKILDLFEYKLNSMLNHYTQIKLDQNCLADCLEVLNVSGRSASQTIGLSAQNITTNWATNRFNARPNNLVNFYDLIKQEFEVRFGEIVNLMYPLVKLVDSDVFWDEVVEVKKTEKVGYVYDLMVPENHNFIGNGIFVHNSNIIDLITFVLGKSSAKEMRAEKSAHLIYNGGKTGEPAKFAECSIVFDNSKKEFPVNAEDIKITRVVKHDGTSVYSLNDQRMNKQQVLDVLNAAKIDPDGHNIVLQGDIVAFTQMKGEERRRIIEEISGISVYEDKKQKAMNELEKVQARLAEVEIVLTERDAYLRELRKEKTQAKRFRELQDEIKNCKGTVLHTYIKEKHDKREEIEKRIEEQKNKIKAIEDRLNEIKKEVSDKELELESTNKNIENKGEKEQIELQKSIEDSKNNVYKATNRLETCGSEVERIKTRKEQLRENINEINGKINEYNKEISNIEKLISELKNKEINLNKSINKLNDGPTGDVYQLSNEIKEVESEIDKIDKNLGKSLNLRQVLLTDCNRLELGLQDINKKISEWQKSNKEQEIKVKKLESLENDFKAKDQELKNKINDASKLSFELESLRNVLNNSMEKLASVRAKQITIKSTISSDRAVEKILSLGDKKVYGTISQLGIVDDEYALALEVAAGQRLKSIVVENEVIASKCINLLKETKSGVATFLPLNKIKPNESQLGRFKSIPGVLAPAIDLVTFDKKFKNIFEYVFGSTLVVKNLDAARKVGVGRIRMVSLDGDLVETSGAMIGGYRSKSLGFQFNEKQLNLDMNSLEEEINKKRKLINDIDKNRLGKEEEVNNLRKIKAEVEGEIIKLKQQLEVTKDNRLIDESEDIKNKLGEKKDELNELDNSIDELNKFLDAFKKKRNELYNKLSNSKSLKVNEELLKLQQEKSEVRERIASLTPQFEGLRTQINSIYKPELDKTNLIIKQIDKESEQFNLEINVLKESLKNNKEELKNKEKLERDFFAQYKELFVTRNRVSERIKKLNETYNLEEKRIKEFEKRLNDLSIDRAKVVAEAEGLEKEFEEFKDAVIKRGLSIDELKNSVKEFEKELQSLGNVNMRALEIFETVEEEYKKILEKVETLKSEKDKVLELMYEIDGNKKEMFLKAFNVINKYFKDIFGSLSNKGEAYLEIENKEDIFNSGIDVKVKLLGSKFLDLNSLSGGEKTLTALSFIFAIQECEPASFYIFDEVDAALDKTNSTLLSQLIAKYSKRAQYVVVSHNDTVITEGDAVYGVSMQDGVSKIFSLKI